MKLLDLFCCSGGAGAGYARAGFEVTGVDIFPQSRYPYAFIRADVLDLPVTFLRQFDAIHASPPCQAYSRAQKLNKNEHPELIGPVREMLIAAGKPFVIENVEGAPLRQPIMLCGAMFEGLRTYRHRLFESNVPLTAPKHPLHESPIAKMGRPVLEHEFMHVVGNFSNVPLGRVAMGIDWMTRDGLREAIPPAYTEYLGGQLLSACAKEHA